MNTFHQCHPAAHSAFGNNAINSDIAGGTVDHPLGGGVYSEGSHTMGPTEKRKKPDGKTLMYIIQKFKRYNVNMPGNIS